MSLSLSPDGRTILFDLLGDFYTVPITGGKATRIVAGIRQGHERAKLAFDIYVHRLRAAIGGMAAVLSGMDVLVFTAGVGENSPEVRAAACSGLEFLGLRLDSKTNARPSLDQEISTADSSVRVLVIRAEEDWAIAKECGKLAQAHQQGQTNASVAQKKSLHKARERQANRALVKSEKG
jgi:predicted NBD/HSP70 family sugar kinase